jgi:hypothetical protein
VVLASAFSGESHMQTSHIGGDREREKLDSLAFLVPPHCIVAAYLEPNSQSMQKPIGGGVAIDAETRQNHAENHTKEGYRPLRTL